MHKSDTTEPKQVELSEDELDTVNGGVPPSGQSFHLREIEGTVTATWTPRSY